MEPDFPSSLEDGSALSAWLTAAPEATLGDEYTRGGHTGTALLVKLIDTDEPLSVQIHPSNDYAGLVPGEAWGPRARAGRPGRGAPRRASDNEVRTACGHRGGGGDSLLGGGVEV